MALSYIFRQSLKRTTRTQRRTQVLLFVFWAMAALAEAGGHWRWFAAGTLALPYVSMYTSLQAQRNRRAMGIRIGSLDERAYLRYGVEFDQLSCEQQHFMLAHYQVGTYIWFPKRTAEDEAHRMQGQAIAWQDARRILAWCAIPLAILYAVGWYLLPAGYVRVAWTNWPVVALALCCVAISLPRLLWTWREPDELSIAALAVPDWV